MLGSLIFSELLAFTPCNLCWYERILLYPLAIILLVGYLRRDKGLFLYVLPFSILGIGVASYHYLLQKTDLFSHGAVCGTGIPCTTIWINLFGFITIPFLVLVAYVIITLAGLIYWSQEMETV